MTYIKSKSPRKKIIDKIPTTKGEKKKAWDKFSIFIRMRDCIKTTGTFVRGRCYTCDRVYDFKDLQAGHFVPGRGNAVLFDEHGVKAQCLQCNFYRGGEPLLFRKKLIIEYGVRLVELLENKRYQTQKYTMSDYQILRRFYIAKTEQLKKFNAKEKK